MASGTRSLGSAREPDEWIRATDAARLARSVVAGQVADLLVAADATGGWELLGARLVELSEARRTGDVLVTRAAVMHIAVAAAQLVVRIDLQQDQPATVRRAARQRELAA